MTTQLRVVKAKKAATTNAARKSSNSSASGGSSGATPSGMDKQTFDEAQELSDQVLILKNIYIYILYCVKQ
jgi:hypothetical protein